MFGKGLARGTGNTAKENWISDINRNRRCLGLVIALSIVCVCISIAAIVCGVLGWRAGSFMSSSTTHLSSGPLPLSPSAHYLASTDGPLAMTIENDLSGRGAGTIYRIYSTTAQPHTVVILAGVENTNFKGNLKTATFGGAIGDGFTFEVTSKNTMAIGPVTNVQFTL